MYQVISKSNKNIQIVGFYSTEAEAKAEIMAEIIELNEKENNNIEISFLSPDADFNILSDGYYIKEINNTITIYQKKTSKKIIVGYIWNGNQDEIIIEKIKSYHIIAFDSELICKSGRFVELIKSNTQKTPKKTKREIDQYWKQYELIVNKTELWDETVHLLKACRENDIDSVKRLMIIENIDICHAFINVCFNNNIELVKLFLTDARINDCFGSALVSAYDNRSYDVIVLLLKEGRVDPSWCEYQLIDWLIRGKQFPIIIELIETGKIPFDVCEGVVLRYLHYDEFIPIRDKIIDNIDIKYISILNDAIGFYISEKNDSFVMWCLENKNVDPSVNNNYALSSAFVMNNIEMIKLLLNDQRVCDNLNDANFKIAFNNCIFAIINNNNHETLQLLLGKKIIVMDNKYLEIACLRGCTEIAKTLIDTKCCSCTDLNLRVYEKAMVELLLEYPEIPTSYLSLYLKNKALDGAINDIKPLFQNTKFVQALENIILNDVYVGGNETVQKEILDLLAVYSHNITCI